jgi:hypothetical protein
MESTATDDGLEEFWGIVGAKKSNADHSSTPIFRTTPAVSGRRERMRASGPLERVVRPTSMLNGLLDYAPVDRHRPGRHSYRTSGHFSSLPDPSLNAIALNPRCS